MFSLLRKLLFVAVPLVLTMFLTGCQDDVSEIAREAADRQAEQNELMAQLQQEVASGTRELVAADAQARQDLLGVHHDLQSERTRLDTAWSALQKARRIESVLAAIFPKLAMILLVCVLLGFCWYVLFAARKGDATDAEINDLLLQEMATDQPQLTTEGPAQHLLDSPEQPGDPPQPARTPPQLTSNL